MEVQKWAMTEPALDGFFGAPTAPFVLTVLSYKSATGTVPSVLSCLIKKEQKNSGSALNDRLLIKGSVEEL